MGESSSISINLNTISNDFMSNQILKYGATDHMTHYFISSLLIHLALVIGKFLLSTVVRIEEVLFTPNLVLTQVLHVPHLSTNLVSIQKLTRDLNEYVTFYTFYCDIQEKALGKSIGPTKEYNCLYLLSTLSLKSFVFCLLLVIEIPFGYIIGDQDMLLSLP